MNRHHWTPFALVCIVILGLFGCQQRPAVPTTAVEPTEAVVIVVVTATSQPTLAPTATSDVQPTITPLRVLTNTVAATSVVTAVRVTATPVSTRVAATNSPRPATAVAPPTAAVVPATAAPTAVAPPTALPAAFAAPSGIAPEGVNFRDGDSLKLQFSSVGPLAGDQCYKLDLFLDNVGFGSAGDNWVGLCGDQSAPGSRLTFTVLPGRFRNDPNYGTVLNVAESYGPAERLNMRWTVTVVHNSGLSSDGVHYNVEPLSPSSATLQNTFIR